MKNKPYEQILETTKIQATSRMSIKMGDSYFTFEAVEERSIMPFTADDATLMAAIDIDKEWEQVWASVHNQVDTQVQDIIEMQRKKKG